MCKILTGFQKAKRALLKKRHGDKGLCDLIMEHRNYNQSGGLEEMEPDWMFAFYNLRGTAEQHVKEGKQAITWTRLSCKALICPRR